MSNDQTQALVEQVREAAAARRPLRIEGSGSKAFYGREIGGEPLALQGHRGIVDYEPTELVLTARAGTPLDDIEAALAEAGQTLPFEPPHYHGGGTLGGAVATGISGPRRPYTGAVRDFVLGVRAINGRGEPLRFGGQVMKNVAGYDVSRLLTGALGTLGVLLEVSLKVLPAPEQERTQVLELDAEAGFKQVERWIGETLPIAGAAHDGKNLYLRLAGAASSVRLAAERIGGEAGEADYWSGLRDHTLGFFTGDKPLWRVSLPQDAPALSLTGEEYQDWGGRLRWLKSEEPAERVFAAAAERGGHAILFRGGDRSAERFQPLPEPVLALHRRIKHSLDPDGILNPGRMYAEI